MEEISEEAEICVSETRYLPEADASGTTIVQDPQTGMVVEKCTVTIGEDGKEHYKFEYPLAPHA